MILFNAFIAIFAIFISPQIFLYYKYQNFNYSLVLLYGVTLSYTGSWVAVLTIYYLNLPNIVPFILIYMISFLSLGYMIIKKRDLNKIPIFFIWIATLLLLIPLFKHIGIGFSVWDVLASWNNWAMELYNNEYYPIDAAYPILLSGIWSLIYKVQGSNEIWWTAQLIHFILPVMIFGLLFVLYYELKNKTFFWMALLLYPYFISIHTINGNMDMPVMLLGMLSLIALYTAEQHKEQKTFNYYVYASLLIAGISSITKQAGLAFLLFDIIYILVNLKYFREKKTLFFVMAISFVYLFSYLTMYYQHNIASPTGNLNHLGNLAQTKLSQLGWSTRYFDWLQNNFFALPANVVFLNPITSLFPVKFYTLYFILIGLLLYVFKGLRQYNSIGFLSALFFILGTLLWSQYFSYDERNALWVKSFFILFFAINIDYFITHYRHKTIYSKIIFTSILIALGAYIFSLGDTFTQKKQKQSQTKAGVRYGCLPSIKYAKKLLKDAKPCVKIYTNELPMPQNYLLKPYKDKFILMGRDYKFQTFQYLEHSCKAGSYIIFRRASVSKKDEWWKVEKLVKDKIIKPLKDANVLAYFVPPHINIDKHYFKKTHIVSLKIDKSVDDIQYNIDKILQSKKLTTITGWAFVKGLKVNSSIKYIVLENEKYKFIIELQIMQRPDVSKHFNTKNLSNSGFKAYLYKDDFPKGEYQMHILIEDEGKKQHLTKIKEKIIL
jgi:hypothetical protein